jgi:hypothetical protein
MTLSALCWWSPVLGSPRTAHALPALAFPFVKLFGPDVTAALEAVAAVLQRVLPGLGGEDWPQPPATLLSPALELLGERDPQLRAHLRDAAGGASAALWQLLGSLFSDALPREAWLQAMDHVFAAPPGSPYAACLAASLLMHARDGLLRCHTRAQLAAALATPTPLPIDAVLLDAYSLMEALRPPPQSPACDAGTSSLGSVRSLRYRPMGPLGARAAAEAERITAFAAAMVVTAPRPRPGQPDSSVLDRPAASAAVTSRRRVSGGGSRARARPTLSEREAQRTAEAETRALRTAAICAERAAAAEAEAEALQARIDAAQRAWEAAAAEAAEAEAAAAALRQQAQLRPGSPRALGAR